MKIYAPDPAKTPLKDILSLIQVATRGDSVNVNRTTHGRFLANDWVDKFCRLLAKNCNPDITLQFQQGCDGVVVQSTNVGVEALADEIRFCLLADGAAQLCTLPIQRQKAFTTTVTACWEITAHPERIQQCVQDIQAVQPPDHTEIQCDSLYVVVRRKEGNMLPIEILMQMLEHQIREHYYW